MSRPLRSLILPLLAFFPAGTPAIGQVDRSLGTTAQGESLRGQAQFLRGMAWYELGTARANAIDQQSLEAWNRSVQAAYAQDLADRARRLASRR